METDLKTQQVMHRHQKAGKYMRLDSMKLFYLDEGKGDVVFCIHGVPTSSFLYRKVVDQIAGRGLRGIALDLPGLGLSDRPENFSYRFSNFATICQLFLDHLGIRSYHLVIHDIGAPIGLALAARHPERVKSITVLNAMLDIENFTKPLPMRPFALPVFGEAELLTLNHTTWKLMMKYAGVEDTDHVPDEEMDTYIDLLKRDDNGKAFLKIMRNFEQTPEFSQQCYSAVREATYPIQLIWGANDPFLDFDTYGRQFLEAAPQARVYQVNSRHFLQEEYPEFIAEKIAKLANEARGRSPQQL
jgi:pimeloyl-ACP methyl ester carboxylesterase